MKRSAPVCILMIICILLTITGSFEPSVAGTMSSTPANTIIACGEYSSVMVKEDGNVYTWGKNREGQLGNGTFIDSSTPVLLSSVTAVSAVAAGEAHVLALKSNGSVVSWGRNFYGQLGNGDSGAGTEKNTPQTVVDSDDTALSGIIAIAAGSNFSAAIKSDGTVYTWGLNTYGQLGNATTTNMSKATVIPSFTSISAIAAAGSHMLALKSDGTLYSWGYNSTGQLGLGNTTSKTSPTKITSVSPNRITKISAGYDHSAFLDERGLLYVWGNNALGQLGDGTIVSRMSPTKLTSIIDISDVVAGNAFTGVIKTDATVWTWGTNTYGQLGTSSASISTPAKIQSLSGILKIAAGNNHMFALKDNGTTWAWGYNSNGQLGVNGLSAQQTATPSQISIQFWPKFHIVTSEVTALISTTATVTLDATFGGKISAFQVNLSYDKDSLTILSGDISKGSMISGNAAWAIRSNVDATAGTIVIVGYCNPVPATNLGDGQLITMDFDVGAGIANDTDLPINITSAMASDDTGKTYSVSYTDGNIKVYQYYKGDINQDGAVDVLDIPEMVDIITGVNAAPSVLELFAADMDDSGGVNILDVVKLVLEI